MIVALVGVALVASGPAALADPEDERAEDAANNHLELSQGLSLVISLPRTPVSFQIADRRVAEASEIGSTALLHVRGMAPGQTDLGITFEGGAVLDYRLSVTPPRLDEFDEEATGSIRTVLGQSTVLSVPSMPSAVAIAAPEILRRVEGTPHDEIHLEGIRPGITDVVLVFDPDRPPLIYTILVTE